VADESNIRPLIGNLVVRAGGSGIVAGSIGEITLGPEPLRTALDPFATVPPLPPAFIDRPELSEPLLERLLSSSAMVAVTAIEGMGGVGKTTVALGLCHAPRIRTAFPDGIIWLSVGRETDARVEKRIEEVAMALNQDFRAYTEAAYRSALKNKAVLVVLDDVWDTESVEPFRLDSGQSRLLYTSRNKSIAGPLNAVEHEVGILDEAQAHRFLRRWSGRDSVAPPEPYATEILAECKGLVLGLAMIGAALKGQPDSEWADTVADLKNAQLKEVGARPGGYAYQTLHASIAVGVDALDPEARSRYLDLAVLLEDMPAPEVLLRALWGVEEREARRVARLYVDRSLARRDARGNIRLHDFQLDYIRGEHPDKTALALEHSALQLSMHVINSHPDQFASQMTWRLLAHRGQPGIAAFLASLESSAPRPRLLPLWPALVAAGGPALRVFETKNTWVRAVALSADGRRAISGSEDSLLRIWDLEGNEPPQILEGHTGQIRAVALSADGNLVASGSEDNTVRIWDLKGSHPPRILRGHTAPVRAVALSADGLRVVSGSLDRTLRVWDLRAGQPPRILNGHTADVNAVALSANGQRAISASHDLTVRVWDLSSDIPAAVLTGHALRIYAVALSADGKRAVSASDDRTLRVWDLSGNQPPRILEGHSGPVTAVALSAKGHRAISGSRDKTLREWDLEGDRPPRILEGHAGFVNAVALSADGRRAVSSSLDLTLRVWDLKGRQRAHPLESHSNSVRTVALSRDGKYAVSGSDDKTIRVWKLVGDQPPIVLKGHLGKIRAVALSRDGKRLVSSSQDKTIRVWNLEGNPVPRILQVYGGEVTAIALSSDGKILVSGSQDKALWAWNLEGGEAPRALELTVGQIRSLALSGDGKRIIIGAGDHTLRIWNLEGGPPPRILKGHRNAVRSITLSDDGRRAVSGSIDCSVWVWDLEGNQPGRALKGHTGPVHAVAISNDGLRIASCSSDRTVRVWSLPTGLCLAAFSCDAEVFSCAWAGGQIVAGDGNGQVHLFAWEE